ncbi:hypothetical protein E1B28_010534 [Marasmius oreades]|uniref:Uncharacterized protein n=1 Tax=Marasmius oreades TaxID=181124 RepID=A0A9P7URV6_9AGAR|nr:uncharacterized protein E1B28_010534 [Marasmius oreades]KAG7091505.1 hypothetical protein E1B28_010534 [Marasmius oreades]
MASREIGGVIDDGEKIGRWIGIGNGMTAVIVIILAGLYGLYRYLRSFIYPCLTPFELEQTSKSLDDVYRSVRDVSAGPAESDAPEWNNIAKDHLSLKIEASDIRKKNLQAASPWKKYLGFHPDTMLEIARWYKKHEELKCRILTAREEHL